MSSYDVLHNDSSSGSFPSGDFSLLHEVEEVTSANGDIQHINYNLTNMPSTMSGIAHDPNAEISLQLTKLISDNLSMKEALDKNNSVMKEQLNTIPAWRDLMKLKMEQQQQSLQEAKAKISSLENENAKLLKKLKNVMEEISKTNEVKDSCIKCETLETTLKNLFGEKDFEEDKGILCNELSNFYGNLEKNLITVCHYLDVLLKSKIDEKQRTLLKTFILLLKYKIASLNGTFCATVQTDEETGYEVVHQKKESTREHSLSLYNEVCKQFEDAKKSIKQKETELSLLKEEKEQLSEKFKVYGLRIQELEMAQKAQFEQFSSKLNHETSIAEKYKERCESLQQHVDEYQEKLDRVKRADDYNRDELQQKVHDLQEILKIEQRSNLKDKDELCRVRRKCEELQVDCERVTKLLEVVSRDEKEKIEKLQALHASNDKTNLEQVDHLTAQLFEVQEELNTSNATIRELKEKLSLVENESGNIPALKAQIEVYKRDFESILTDKKSALEEVERLTQELRRVEANESSYSEHKAYKDDMDAIKCPICFNVFATWEELQTHVNQCLEESS